MMKKVLSFAVIACIVLNLYVIFESDLEAVFNAKDSKTHALDSLRHKKTIPSATCFIFI